jgi:hypothetical protein
VGEEGDHMNCPECGYNKIKVLSSRKQGISERKRRECYRCGYRFTTYETLDIDYHKIKPVPLRGLVMKSVTFFETQKELRLLTGLHTYQSLIAAGFDLDDWDFGFVSDTPWDLEGWLDGSSCKAPYFEYWLLSHMDSHANHCSHVEYGSRHYYIAYHA